MKKIFYALLLLLPAMAFSQGIQFDETQDWAAIQQKAKAENKMIFVDAYTTWCGPCKKMSADVFPQPEAGNLYNAQFINVKLDMEKGQGIGFARKYKVNSYPQLLFIDTAGNLVHYGVGYMETKDLVNLGKAASNPDEQIGTLTAGLEAGTLTLAQKRTLYRPLSARNPAKAAKLAKEILDAEPQNWGTRENVMMMFMMQPKPGDPYFEYLWKNSADIDKNLGDGKSSIKPELENMVRTYAMRKHPKFAKDAADSQAFVALLSAYLPAERVGIEMLKAKVMPAVQFNNAKAVLANAADISKHKESFDAEELNSLAWLVYEKADMASPEQLMAATSWAKRSVELSEKSHNTDSYAHLLAKTGDKAAAKKWAKRSIELGKASGEDTSTTEELLKSL